MQVMGLRIGALLGWGLGIYAIMFLIWSAFIVYGFTSGLLPRVVSMAILVILVLIAGRSLRARTWHDIFPYSLCWGLIMVLLDAIMSVPYGGWMIYADVSTWLGYAIVVFGPTLALYPYFGNLPTLYRKT